MHFVYFNGAMMESIYYINWSVNDLSGGKSNYLAAERCSESYEIVFILGSFYSCKGAKRKAKKSFLGRERSNASNFLHERRQNDSETEII